MGARLGASALLAMASPQIHEEMQLDCKMLYDLAKGIMKRPLTVDDEYLDLIRLWQEADEIEIADSLSHRGRRVQFRTFHISYWNRGRATFQPKDKAMTLMLQGPSGNDPGRIILNRCVVEPEAEPEATAKASASTSSTGAMASAAATGATSSARASATAMGSRAAATATVSRSSGTATRSRSPRRSAPGPDILWF